jgi:hypothetical protein
MDKLGQVVFTYLRQSSVAEFKVQVVRQAWGKVLQVSDILPITTIRLIDKYIIKEPYIPFTYNKKD